MAAIAKTSSLKFVLIVWTWRFESIIAPILLDGYWHVMKQQVRHARLVTFVNAEDYKDTICCDVQPLDSGDILLGRPGMYDKNRTHGMRDITYTLVHNGKYVTLDPMKP